MMHQHTFQCTFDEPVVETRQGKLRGFMRDGVYQFWGVRYGRAKRFEMPVEPESWEGVKDALAYGYVSPLLEEPLPGNELTVPHRYWPMEEDCLNLNIATPTIDPEAKKPVMVWYHGGGFADGSAIAHIAFEGDNMARNHDVVMVCVNHRLNAFGFMDVSCFGEKFWNSGNAGVVDLEYSLRWIQKNIRAFGGDPENVTIFGQSGGGGKVNTLLQAPSCAGLFQKAIVMSGVFDPGRLEEHPEADPKEFAEEVLRQLKLPEGDIEGLQKVHFRLFIMAVNRAIRVFGKRGQVVSWRPHVNAWYPGYPLDIGFSEHAKKVPLMIGSTLGEFTNPRTPKNKSAMTDQEQEAYVLSYFGEEEGKKVLELFRKTYPGKNLAYAPFVDSLVRRGSVKYAKLKAEQSEAPAYAYLLSSCYEMDSGMPAWHNSDIPYAFGNGDIISYCSATENWQDIAELLPAAFSAFAHNGDPNCEGLPKWEAAEKDSLCTMVFDAKIEAKTDFDDELIEKLTELIPGFSFGHHNPKTDEDPEGHEWTY
ncbi:MAG: carboxylesterase/lipase family protein [Lachnospiraceae bacterium]|nr:carboxylesterase/lipase family protein [Lachnospiraceae bacterium]